ncbi:MAG: DEAD/DEAH box helicase [Candidatus Saccharimonadales bacterium]
MSYNSYSSRRSSSSFSRGRHFAPPKRAKRGRGEYIDPSRFVKPAKPVIEAEAFVPVHVFDDFAVEAIIKQNLAGKGYTEPSPIQDQTIPLGLEGKDVIGIANTGTGKTAAFAVPVIQKLIKGDSQALIIAPTRELAQQIEQEFRSIGKGSGLFGTLLIGGANIGPQLRDLKQRPEIVIGTPGRIKDHLERRTLDLSKFNIVVLDEVDRMLDMGFINDVRDILSNLARERQSFFFSATMEPKVKTLIETFSNDPVTVTVKTGETSDFVHQDVVHYQSKEDKMAKLHDLLITGDIKAIVFDETQRSVERLSKELIARGFNADAIHGGKTQGQRQRALDRFKKNQIKILVATDVAARGIDVVDITHVINYAQPQSYEDYVHRIGRAGRAGRVGHALTFVER